MSVETPNRSMQEQRDDAVAEFEKLFYEQQAAQLKGEGIQESDWNRSDWHSVGSSRDMAGRPTNGPRGMLFTASQLRDRQEGRYLPFYETEEDLARMRSQCRNLATFTAIATGAQESLTNYVIGGEWQFTAEGKTDEAPSGFIEAVQAFIDDWLEFNDFSGELDREIHNGSREDGEYLLALQPLTGGMSSVVSLDPQQLTEPANPKPLEEWIGVHTESSWTFGVHRLVDERTGQENHLAAGYHIVYDETGRNYDYLPEWPQTHFDDGRGRCMTLFRRNVPRSAKRGISDYWAIVQDLEREYKLTRNTAEGAAVQAAIAYILEHGGGSSLSHAEDRRAADSILSYQQSKQGGSSTQYVRKFNPGTVIQTKQGQQYHAGPIGQLRSPIFIEVAGALMRRIGTRWNMPEYMISGDASNSAFASTLVSESPFLRSRVSDQAYYKRRFKKVIMKAIKIAWISGRFDRWVQSWQELLTKIKLGIVAPVVESRDPLITAQVASLQIRDGYLSRQTAAEEQGRDYEQETERGAGVASPSAPTGQYMRQGDRVMESTSLSNCGTGGANNNKDLPDDANAFDAAVSAALESVETTDEARAILESCMDIKGAGLLESENCGTGDGGFKVGNT